jgi:hypothetical protein
MKRHWHAGVGVLPLAVFGACLGRRAGPHPDAKRRWDLCPCHHLGCHREDRCMATLVRHGTYRWTTSSPSWMKAATRVTPRGSRPCPGIIGERYDGRAAVDRPAVQHLPGTAGSAGCAARLGAGNYPAVPARTAGGVARPRSRCSTRAPSTPQTPRPRPGPAPAAYARLARLAAGCYTGRRDLESGLVRLALADHRRGWAYARAGTRASCSGRALSAID